MKVQILAVAVLVALGAVTAPTAHAAPAPMVEAPVLDEITTTVDTAPAAVSSTGAFQQVVLLQSDGNTAVYRHQFDLPAGARVQASAGEKNAFDLTGDLEVVDAKGTVIGAIDAAWAQDSTGQSLPSHYNIEGNTLVQIVDTSLALGQVTALVQYTGAQAQSPAVSAKAYVGIPSNYVYNLNHPRKTLHDYCTKSPDEFPNPVGANANFRGPCARHDMCFEQKQASQYTCNNRLWSNMVSNCEYTYAWYNPVRQTCINTAHVYWIAVTANTLWPG